jgi:hypothetical protein
MTNQIRSATSAGLLFGVALTSIVMSFIFFRHQTPKKYKEPNPKDFQAHALVLENEIILDLDKDGRADLILDRGTDNWIKFYKKGYERKTGHDTIPGYSLEMSSNLESIATTLLKDSSELRYQESRLRYTTRK